MRVETTNPVSPVGAVSAEEAKAPAARAPARSRPRAQLPAESTARQSVLDTPQHSLSIQVDDHQRVFYQVINSKTGEVVRQIPPEEVRRAGRQVDDLLRRQAAAAVHKVDISS